MINNAGANHLGEPAGFDVAVAENLFALNMFSPMRLAEAVLPTMRRRQQGTIVNIASIAAANAWDDDALYGYEGNWPMLEGLATQLEDEGIKVLTVYRASEDTHGGSRT